MDDERSQLDALIDDLARATDCRAAAELDVAERQADEAEAKARTERAERELKDAISKEDDAWRAVRRRIEAQTHSALDDELTERRCTAALLSIRKR